METVVAIAALRILLTFFVLIAISDLTIVNTQSKTSQLRLADRGKKAAAC
jgi:hypothetical protein